MWGQLLKTGYQNSRFAHQVERFACLYTSHVSNLAFYSPDKSYRCVTAEQMNRMLRSKSMILYNDHILELPVEPKLSALLW